MKTRLVIVFVFVLFAAALAGVLQAPELWIDPGGLLKGHAKIEGECSKCHTPLLGPSNEKCIACHKPAEIRSKKKSRVPFHQNLKEKSCTACHTDHLGPDAAGATREFKHDLLEQSVLASCQECHTKPTDTLHRNVVANCGTCHSNTAWKPATFDHARYFRFDRDHPPDCKTCHTEGDYKRYTCYGCHEHSERNVRKEHLEEGIRDFQNCTRCHRSADEDEAERIWESIRRGRPGADGRKRRKDDD